MKKRLKYLFLSLLIFLPVNNSFSQWTRMTSNTTSRLNSVYFINDNTGWICGFETVLKTTDGGNSWASSFLNGSHRSVTFINSTTGWICGESGRLYKTVNAGNNWDLVNANVNVYLNQITFVNENTGFIVGNAGTILKTTDAGINWFNAVSNFMLEDFYSVKVLNNEKIIVTGTNSHILKSTDGGSSWSSSSFGMPIRLLPLILLMKIKDGFQVAAECLWGQLMPE